MPWQERIMSDETARLLGAACGRWAWEYGATEGKAGADPTFCDCVMIEESQMYAGLCDAEFNTDDKKHPAYRPYDLMFEAMYAEARRLHREFGPRPGI